MPTPHADPASLAGRATALPTPLTVAAVALFVLTVALVSMGGGLLTPLEAQLPEDPAAAAVALGNSPVAVGSRLTARLTFVFFIAAYLARPVWQRFRWPAARWALRNRRWLGLAAAVSHSVHLSYVVATQLAGNDPLDVVTLVGGGLGFALFWLMGITSHDGAVRGLGRGWGWLHRGGLHYLWFIFLITYAGAATLHPWLWGFVALLVFGALLRLANHWWPPQRDGG